MSWTSWKCRSSLAATRCSSAYTFASLPRFIFARGTGVRVPETTSSPCAFARKSPLRTFSPVRQSRVNATPVPESFPMLPYTMATTFTAVPMSSGMLWTRR